MISPVANLPPRPDHRRRKHYVDSSIQRSLLVAMVVLEVTLVAAAVGFAYWRLIELIDASMYRMNAVQTGPTMLLFAPEGLWVLGLFAVVNLVALMVAAGIWGRHENLVLREFMRLTGKSRELDFSRDMDTLPQHEVLELALAWREQERIRFAAIRDQVAKMEAVASTEKSPPNLQILVDSLNKLLP